MHDLQDKQQDILQHSLRYLDICICLAYQYPKDTALKLFPHAAQYL